MSLTDRFQLFDLKRDEGARSFEAREIATGRPVFVHLFADRTSPLNRALLAKVETLPPQERARIIDRGEHEGGVYLVTDRLAEYPGLREWLSQKDPDSAKDLSVAGAWQVPKLPPPTPPMPAPNPDLDDQLAHLFDTVPRPIPEPVPGVGAPDNPKLSNTSEHTLEISLPPEMREVKPPSAPPVPAPVLRPAPVQKESAPPPAPPLPANEPGEFTRQFNPVLRPPPVQTAPSAPASEPGEFTRQFVPPVLRPAPAPPPSVAPLASAPEPGEFTRQFVAPQAQKAPEPAGEFTKLFQRPNLTPKGSVPAPSPIPAPPPSNAQPGEFTQMLQAQRPSAPPPPVNKASQSGEFARYFESPMTPPAQGSQGSTPVYTPTPTPPQPPRGAGEFTQVFGRGDIPSPPPPPAPAAPPPSSSNNATQVFAAPRPAAPPPMSPVTSLMHASPKAPPQGPGEYTRMFSAPAPLTLGQPQANPQGPRGPEARPPARNRSRLPMLLMIGGAVLLILAVIVYFVMRSRPA